MEVDGAAFLVDDGPVIGMTLRRDRLDNFWFTLLHEIAHVVLHYRTGLSAGFFDDDVTAKGVDELEEEANDFAGNLLLPDKVWTRSPARIARTAEPVESLRGGSASIPPSCSAGSGWSGTTILSFEQIGHGLVRRQLMTRC